MRRRNIGSNNRPYRGRSKTTTADAEAKNTEDTNIKGEKRDAPSKPTNKTNARISRLKVVQRRRIN